MKTDTLAASVRPAFEMFLAALDTHSLRYAVIETLRPQAVQDAYYAQGRQNIEEINRLRRIAGLYLVGEAEAKRIITNSKHSVHQDGRAADIVPVLGNGKIPWNIDAACAELWRMFGRIGQEAGLEWGGAWKPLDIWGIGWDAPHYQKTA